HHALQPGRGRPRRDAVSGQRAAGLDPLGQLPRAALLRDLGRATTVDVGPARRRALPGCVAAAVDLLLGGRDGDRSVGLRRLAEAGPPTGNSEHLTGRLIVWS